MNDGDRQDAKVPNRYSSSWKQSALDLVKGEYHIVHDGILTRRDFSLLFESDETRRRLPVETMKQINVYSDVQIAPSALSLLSKHVFASHFSIFMETCKDSILPMKLVTLPRAYLDNMSYALSRHCDLSMRRSSREQRSEACLQL